MRGGAPSSTCSSGASAPPADRSPRPFAHYARFGRFPVGAGLLFAARPSAGRPLSTCCTAHTQEGAARLAGILAALPTFATSSNAHPCESRNQAVYVAGQEAPGVYTPAHRCRSSRQTGPTGARHTTPLTLEARSTGSWPTTLQLRMISSPTRNSVHRRGVPSAGVERFRSSTRRRQLATGWTCPLTWELRSRRQR